MTYNTTSFLTIWKIHKNRYEKNLSQVREDYALRRIVCQEAGQHDNDKGDSDPERPPFSYDMVPAPAFCQRMTWCLKSVDDVFMGVKWPYKSLSLNALKSLKSFTYVSPDVFSAFYNLLIINTLQERVRVSFSAQNKG